MANPLIKDDDDDDDEDEQANMSLAAMEAALKPQVLETLATGSPRTYEQLSEMQDSRISATLNEDAAASVHDKAESVHTKNCARKSCSW